MPTSVIIPHYELHDMVKNICLPNLYLFSNNNEVRLVDNGSKAPFLNDGPQVIVRSKERISFAACCNLGAKDSIGEILIFLNNDCQVLAGWLKPILEAFEDKKVAIVGAKLLDAQARIQHVGIKFSKKRIPYHPHMGEEDNPKDNKTVDVLAVTGALMAVRKYFFNEVGGFSEEFPEGNYEDVDLCLQARKLGYKVKVAKSSKAIYVGGASYKLHPEEHSSLLVRRNWEILNSRWKDESNKFFGITSKSFEHQWEKEWDL